MSHDYTIIVTETTETKEQNDILNTLKFTVQNIYNLLLQLY